MSDEEEDAPPAPEENLGSLSAGLKWKFVPSEVEQWYKLSHDDIKAEISGKLDHVSDFRDDIISDFHLFNLVHARSICLSPRQAAVWMSIMSSVLEKLQAKSQTCKYPGDSCQYSEVFDLFQTLLIAHCGGKKTKVFTAQEARLLIDFATLTFFKHFLLYQYCLVFARDTEVIRVDLEMETPVPIPPLSTAKRLPKTPPQPTLVPTEFPRSPVATRAPPEKENQPLPPALQKLIEEKINAAEEKFMSKIDELQQTMK